MAYSPEHVLFSSNLGDTVSPIVKNLTVNQNTTLNGTVSGTGFTAAVQAIIESDAPALRNLALTDVKTDAGVPMVTATAATTLPGISRTAGTSMYLTGVATSGTTPATTKMLWEFNLPSTYVAGAAIPVKVNCVVPVATDVTAGSTTMTVAAYSESSSGVETALTVSAAQQIPLTTAGTLTFSVTGTGLTPGARVALELNALVTTTTGGASSMQVNSVGYTA